MIPVRAHQYYTVGSPETDVIVFQLILVGDEIIVILNFLIIPWFADNVMVDHTLMHHLLLEVDPDVVYLIRTWSV